MATTLAEDIVEFDRIMGPFGKKRAIKGSGRLFFAGNYWPPRSVRGQVSRLALSCELRVRPKSQRKKADGSVLAASLVRDVFV